MSQAPTVSVLMPAYNAERFIREAVDSILAQSFQDFELIIVDDGSKDGTASIIQSYSDERIRLIQKENEGVATTLNRGIELAKGQYIWRHDADDVSLSGKLKAEVDFMESHQDCLLVATQVAFMTERGKVAWEKKQPKDKWLGQDEVRWVSFEDFSPFSPITHGTALIRTSAFKKAGSYREAFITSEDIDMWLRIIEHGKLAVLNSCLSLHRISASSATAVHGWKNEFYRELAKTYWHQRKDGNQDDLEINGFIKEPKAPSNHTGKPGRTFRSDLLNFHYSVHLNARDWREVLRIIKLALVDGWRLPHVHRAILMPLLPRAIVKGGIAIKSLLRGNTATS